MTKATIPAIALTLAIGLSAHAADEAQDSISVGVAKVVNRRAASGTALTILVGATGDPSGKDKLDLALPALAKLTGDLTTIANAQTAMGSVDTLLNTVNGFLGNVGALQSRLDFASQNLATTIQNTAAAESAIRDVDMAQEMTTFSKNQILQQAGTAMLAQANQLGQGVLTLLRG